MSELLQSTVVWVNDRPRLAKWAVTSYGYTKYFRYKKEASKYFREVVNKYCGTLKQYTMRIWEDSDDRRVQVEDTVQYGNKGIQFFVLRAFKTPFSPERYKQEYGVDVN